MSGEIVRLLSDHSILGQAYRVDMRLRPEGDQGQLAQSLAATLGYYETSGRTWERQALIKCRPVAGDLSLGQEFLASIAPFVYQRYLGGAEIGGIKAMKRRIEAHTRIAGEDDRAVKTGHGGIRDVEFVVQFLQLLHGGGDPSVRHHNTLIALSRLEQIGCLSPEERGIMEETYRFLRKVEHRLQTMFDRQTHQMPSDQEEMRTLAIKMGYPAASAWEDRAGPAQRFLADYRAKTDLNRKILNHLLHDAFADDASADPAVDLVLDPDPSPELIVSVLERYHFRDVPLAYKNLMALSREDISFLSPARCRHFLAAIAPRLLDAVARAPDPDMALTNLEKVSASLGAKAILWELFSFNPPTLKLYVDLCASSQFLSDVLINNPGMIDDLMDSLVVDRPQSAKAIKEELAELCRGAEDLAPILLSFRNKEWVRIGVRDILSREPMRDVTRELADVAEAIVGQVAHHQWKKRIAGDRDSRMASIGRPMRWAILGLGKLGGREMNYHSDLDLVFVFNGQGTTVGNANETSNEEFFAEFAQKVIRDLGGSDETGSLYQVDTRLRPYGASGPLAVSLDTFRNYFLNSAAHWERMALTRARPLFATGTFGRDVAGVIREILAVPQDSHQLASEALAMRKRLGESRGPNDLKRGVGGLVDIEFLVQYLILIHASTEPGVLKANVWEALDALRRFGALSAEDHADLRDAYSFLRTVESRLRIVHNRTNVGLPDNWNELSRLAKRLGYQDQPAVDAVTAFRSDLERLSSRTRSIFSQIIGSTGEGSS